MINLIKSEINYAAEQHAEILNNHDAITTNWTAFHSLTNPGFFTSFRHPGMGIKQAAIATGLLPALQLQKALVSALTVPASVLLTIRFILEGNWSRINPACVHILTEAAQAIYFSAAFFLNLIKEITALITRSIATLIDLCMGSRNNMGPVSYHSLEDDALFQEEEASEDEDLFGNENRHYFMNV